VGSRYCDGHRSRGEQKDRDLEYDLVKQRLREAGQDQLLQEVRREIITSTVPTAQPQSPRKIRGSVMVSSPASSPVKDKTQEQIDRLTRELQQLRQQSQHLQQLQQQLQQPQPPNSPMSELSQQFSGTTLDVTAPESSREKGQHT